MARDYFDESKKKKKNSSSDSRSAAKETRSIKSNKAGSSSKSQSSSYSDRINQKSYGTTSPTLRTNTSRSANTVQRSSGSSSTTNRQTSTQDTSTSTGTRRASFTTTASNYGRTNNTQNTARATAQSTIQRDQERGQSRTTYQKLEEDRIRREKESKERRDKLNSKAKAAQAQKTSGGITREQQQQMKAGLKAGYKEIASAGEENRKLSQRQKSGTQTAADLQKGSERRRAIASDLGSSMTSENRALMQRQKAGTLTQDDKKKIAEWEENRAATRIPSNTLRAGEKGVKDSLSGFGQTFSELSLMAAKSKNGTQAKAMKMGIQDDEEQMRKLEEEQKKIADESRKLSQKLYEQQQLRQADFDERLKKVGRLEKAWYQGTESGLGMATDAAVGALTGTGQFGALASMGLRTFGSSANQAKAMGATDEEAWRYGLAQSGKEIATELAFQGTGAAAATYNKIAGRKVGLAWADKAANALTKGLTGKKADVLHAGIKLLGGTAEEGAEEFLGWLADPVISEATYGKNVRERYKEVLNAGVPKANSKEEADAIAAYFSTDKFETDLARDFMEEGMSEKEAKELASVYKEYYTALYSGDEETVDRIAGELSGAEALSWSSWSRDELIDTLLSTAMLTATTGAPAAISSSVMGNQYFDSEAVKMQFGEKAAEYVANEVINSSDAKLSVQAQAMKDRLDSGKDLTGTQKFQLMQGFQKKIKDSAERQSPWVQTAATEIEKNQYVNPIAVDENGNFDRRPREDYEYYRAGDETQKNYEANFSSARQTAENIAKSDSSISETEKDRMDQIAAAVSSVKDGGLTVGNAHEFAYGNTLAREVLKQETGIDLDQYVVRDNKGNVDYAATAVATEEALFKAAAENYVETARAETEAFVDHRKGEMDLDIMSRLGSEGQAAWKEINQDLDPRDMQTYLKTANAASYMYAAGRNSDLDLNAVRSATGNLFSSVSDSTLAKAFDAGRADRLAANTPAVGQTVEAGKAMSETSTESIPVGELTIDENIPVSVPDSTQQVYKALAEATGVNIHLVANLDIKDENGKVIGQANGMSQGDTIVLNLNSKAESNLGYVFMHEMTHQIKKYAPNEYMALENLIRDTWFEKDYAGMQKAIKHKIDLYAANNQTLDEAGAMEEIVADAMAEAMDDPTFAFSICKENETLGKAILNSIRGALRSLRQMLANGVSNKNFHGQLLSYLDILKTAEALWIHALDSATRARASQAINEKQDEMNVRYSAQQPFVGRNINMTPDTRIPFLRSVKYVQVARKDSVALQKLQDKVKKLPRWNLTNAATGYKAYINARTIGKLITPTHKGFDEYSQQYIDNLNAAAHLPSLFRRAVYLDTKKNQKAKNANMQKLDYHHFIAPIRMNGKDYRVRIVARETIDRDSLYIVNVEALPIKIGQSAAISKTATMRTNPDIKVTDLVNGVKIDNYDGTPPTVYTGNDLKFSLGYHAGDLGKSRGDDFWGQGYSRHTGHFGFGTYFVGDPAKLNQGYAERSRETVDFDNYNLFKPSSADKGYKLHDALRRLDGFIQDYSKFSRYSDALLSDDRAAWDEYVYIKSFAVNDLEDITWDMYEGNDVNEEKKANVDNYIENLLPDDYREEIKERTDKLKENNKDENAPKTDEYWRYEAAIKVAKEYAKDFESEYDKLKHISGELQSALDYKFRERDIKEALKKTEEIIQGYGEKARAERGLDTAATVFMKQLGYEGVDVRGIEELDNTGYGSVIYDLKGEDLARKEEIGTAKFSLKAPVERVGDLVAVHNVKETDLPGMFELGGMPVPSIAIVKDSMGHDQYGAISFLFHSDTINPEKSRYNKVYGGDAYTPTFPSVSKKISYDKAEEIRSKLKDILNIENEYQDVPSGLQFPSLDTDNLTNYLDYREPHEAFSNGRGSELFKLAYLKDAKGMDVEVPMKTDNIKGENADFWDKLDKILPELTRGDAYNMSYEDAKQYEPAIRELLNKQFAEKFPDSKIVLHSEELPYGDLTGPRSYIGGMVYYRENGLPQVVDTIALDKTLKENVDEEGYNKWIDNLFDGIIEKKGLRNNKDLFTPSGNRRSWEALHDPVTIEAVVNIMRNELAQGGEGFFGANPKGAAQKSYKNLDEIIADEDRLQMMDEEEYSALTDEGLSKMAEVAQSIVDKNTPGRFSKDQFGAALDVGGYIAEVLNETRNKDRMKSLFDRDYGMKVSDEQIEEILAATEILAEAPTGYFEAKPQRAVGFDEVKAAIVPNTLDKDLKTQLADRGIRVDEYDPEVEGDRQRVLNQAADEGDLKFSLNSEGEELSQGQETFFERSKNRNAEGQLKVMLHGTDADFTEFDPSKAKNGTLGRAFYFSDSASHAGQYGNVGRYYLNLENPLTGNTHNITKDQLRRFVAYLAGNEDYGIENYGADATIDSVTDSVWGGTDFAMLRDLNLSAVGDFAEAVKVFNRVNGTDYDGIITDVETAAFYPEQIKRTDNLNPTLNKDTRYSITDADGKLLSDGQVKYFRNSQARDEQGRLLTLYHGTAFAGFNIFYPGRLIWLTTSRRDADAYGGNWEHKLYDPNETASTESIVAGSYNLEDINSSYAYMTFDTETDREQFIAEHPDIDKAHSYWELDDLNFEGEIDDEEFSRLVKADKKIRSDYSKYEEKHSRTATWGDVLDNPEPFSKRDIARALLAYDKNIAIDEEQEDSKEDLLEVMRGIADEYESESGEEIENLRSLEFTARVPVGETSEYEHTVNNRTYELYANVTNPMIVDMKGKSMEQGGYAYVEEMVANDDYDGIIIMNTSVGKYHDPQTIVIAKSSNQVKLTDNENPTENPDIRYSITPEDEALDRIAYEAAIDNSIEAIARYEEMLDESDAETYYAKPFKEEDIAEFFAGLNYDEAVVSADPVQEEDRVRMAKSKADFMRNLNAKWNDRWTTEGRVLDVKTVKTDVRNLIMGVMANSDTNAKYRTELVNKTLIDLKNAYQLMKQDRQDVAATLLYHSAQRMIDGVEFYVDDYAFDDYKAIKEYFDTTKISLGEEYWSDVDFGAFRKRNFGRMKRLVKGNTNVDQVYQELAELFPQYFNEEENYTVPDQLEQMAHVLDILQPYKEAYSSEAAAELAFDIADSLYDIMEGGKEYASLADTYKQRFDAKTKAMKQRHAEAMLKLRQQRDEGIKAERAKWRAREEAGKDKAARNKAFGKIQQDYDWLVQRVLDPTKEKNVPEEFRKSLADMLVTLDLQSMNSKVQEFKKNHVGQKTFKMRELKDRLNDLATKKGEDGNNIFEIDANVGYLMESLTKKLDGQPIDALDTATMRDIGIVLAAIKHNMQRVNQVRIEAKRAETQEIAGNIIDDFKAYVSKRGRYKTYGGLREGLRTINTAQLTPAYFFERLGSLNTMYNELRYGGFDTYINNEKYIIERMAEITKDYYKTNKIRKSRPKPGSELEEWRDDRSAQTFNLTHGTVRMTVAQMMSLYCLAQRPQAMQHMVGPRGSGISVTPIQIGSKIEAAKKKAKGQEETGASIKLTEADIQTIITQLTPEQINIAQQLQQLMAVDMAEIGNKAHVEMYGYEAFNDDNYFPIKVRGSEIATDINNIGEVIEKVKSFGPAKPLDPNANNVIEIDDIFTVTAQHCNGMNVYASFLVPISDFMKVYNYKMRYDDGTTMTVKEALEAAHGKRAEQYIINFMKDINGIKPDNRGGLEGLINKALGTAKKTAVFGNVRVALQQPTAIVRAAAEIDPKYLTPFINVRPEKGVMKEMWDYCPIAYWKSLGFYDAYMGRDLEDIMMNNWSVMDAALSDIYGSLDNWTWSLIWRAVKAEQAELNPGMDVKSEEFLNLCGRRASEIFDKTQVVDSTFHRSDAMRSNQIAIKSLTAFMAEPTLTLNVFRAGVARATDAWMEGDKTKAAKIFNRALSVIIAQAALVSLAQAIADAWRGKDPDLPWEDDDDDEEKPGYFDLLVQNLVANFFENLHLENNIYLIKDGMPLFNYIMSKAGDYHEWNPTFRFIMGWDQDYRYSNSNLIYAGGENIADGIAQIYKKLTKGDDYDKSWYDIIQKTAGGFGTFTGVPIGTLMRDFKPLLEKAFQVTFAASGEDEMTFVDNVVKKLGYVKKDSKAEASEGESADSGMSKEELAKKYPNLSDEELDEIVKAGNKRAEKSSGNTGSAEMLSRDEMLAKALKASAGLEGDEKNKKIYNAVSHNLKDYIASGDWGYINQMRSIVSELGGDTEYFDKQVLKNTKTEFKKTLNIDMSPGEAVVQSRMHNQMVRLGMTEEQISSEILYESEAAKDLKVAFRLNNKELIEEAAAPLVNAGLTEEDWEKLYKNRNRIDLKKYEGRYKDQLKSTGNFIWPTQGTVTSHYGYRGDDPSLPAGASTNHPSIDIGAPEGTDVVAADGGTVIYVGWNGGYGNSVGIKHDNGMVTYYNHLSGYSVNEGDTVSQGQYIAAVGSTGVSSGAHLDFKILDENGNTVDPESLLENKAS